MSNSKKEKIIIVSHSFLNDAVRTKGENEHEFAQRRLAKRSFIKKMIMDDVDIIQLPCPEFTIYGANRWAQTTSQLDTVHFRTVARDLLRPIVEQLVEYAKYPNRFEIIGVMGVDGSPSSGINYTYDGNWGGELYNNPFIEYTINSIKKENKPGILITVFKELLIEHKLALNFYSLETYPAKTTASNYNFMDIKLNEDKND